MENSYLEYRNRVYEKCLDAGMDSQQIRITLDAYDFAVMHALETYEQYNVFRDNIIDVLGEKKVDEIENMGVIPFYTEERMFATYRYRERIKQWNV